MHKLKEHIANLKIQLEDIQNQLKPWLNKTAKQEVQSQLYAIVKSSDKLTKTEVNIPTELRELKFKLIKELDKYKEAEELEKELLGILSQYVSVNQQSKPSKPIFCSACTDSVRKSSYIPPCTIPNKLFGLSANACL